MQSVPRSYKEDNWSKSRVLREFVKRRLSAVYRVVGYSPDSNDLGTKAEESPLLRSVTRK
jgi:hypothetical protein